MGFVTGRIYQLTLEYDPAAKWWTARTRNGPRAIWCPYASPEAFLANWSPLEATVTVKRRFDHGQEQKAPPPGAQDL